MNRILIAAVFIVLVFLQACKGEGDDFKNTKKNVNVIPQNSEIILVKNGQFSQYQSTTVGKAFDASFGSPKWSFIESVKGQKVVEFSGIIDESFAAFIANEFIQSGLSSSLYHSSNPSTTKLAYALSALNELHAKYPVQHKYTQSQMQMILLRGAEIDVLVQIPQYFEYRKKYSPLTSLALLYNDITGMKFDLQFPINVAGNSFEIGYFGVSESKMKLQEILSQDKLLEFVYSEHVYEPSVTAKVDNSNPVKKSGFQSNNSGSSSLKDQEMKRCVKSQTFAAVEFGGADRKSAEKSARDYCKTAVESWILCMKHNNNNKDYCTLSIYGEGD